LSNNIYILLNIFALFTKKDYNIFTVKGVCMSKQPKNTRLESVLPINNNKKTIRKITKTEAVRMVGNSVPPHFATAIINALEEENHEDEGTIEEKAS
jgi:site-specific DNA-cytosine methylase